MFTRSFRWLSLAAACIAGTASRADQPGDALIVASDAPAAVTYAGDRPVAGNVSVMAGDRTVSASAPAAPRRFVAATDERPIPNATASDELSPQPSSPPLAPAQSPVDATHAADARLTDEEIALIRRWAKGVAQREDRQIKDAGFTRQDPFADDPQQPNDPPPTPPDETPSDAMPSERDDASANGNRPANGQSNQAGQTAQRGRGFDPAVVAAGAAAFQSSCTACHDAERSTSARKSLGGWMATVRRMAAKEGADVSPSDVQPIATYLASLNPATESEAGGTSAAAAAESSWSLFSTVSLNHRSGAREEIENRGFFPEVWLGAEWHPAGPLSGRVNACVSCHTENAAVSNRIELAEGFLRLDVMKLAGCEDPACQPFQLHVDAGRFIVPFGAFAAQSHPGAFRTATRPLMYNMGQNVYRDELPPPLLPMPYADEGVLASATLPLFAEVNATFDFYAVNGLQGSTDLELGSWFQSRDYVDNNTEPAVGGRATLGNNYLRAGASLMSGRYNENTLQAAVPEILDYKIYGVDLVARYEDWVRIQVEWARRDNDAFDFLAGDVTREAIKGTVIEGEFKLWSKPKVSAIVRYDDQRRTDGPPRFGTPILTPETSVQRFTYGLNVALGSSTLMVNHEHWKVPDPLNDLDVLAIRWVAAF
ncbi:MAG: hypothetical protein DCC68_06280 [Planctomycetota bacterium]|nr:MAG: hypothetical protein DCC68_06280 [Planctomycetota bacterium]